MAHFDYSTPGAYFFTICTQERECLFGAAENSVMNLWPAGEMVWGVWRDLPNRFEGLELVEFIVMPNHIHGIVYLETALLENRYSFSDVMRVLKSMTTDLYIKGVRSGQWPPFFGRLWQKNLHESILRNAEDAERAAAYIRNNPKNWNEDNNHPLRWFDPRGSTIKM